MNARISAGIAVHRISSVVLPCTCSGRSLVAPPPKAADRVEENPLDEDEDGRPQPDEDVEEAADFAIELRVAVKDGVRVAALLHAVRATAARAGSAAVAAGAVGEARACGDPCSGSVGRSAAARVRSALMWYVQRREKYRARIGESNARACTRSCRTFPDTVLRAASRASRAAIFEPRRAGLRASFSVWFSFTRTIAMSMRLAKRADPFAQHADARLLVRAAAHDEVHRQRPGRRSGRTAP